MNLSTSLLAGAVAPALVGVAILFVGSRVPTAARSAWLAPLVVWAGALTGQLVALGVPAVPPVDATAWLPWVTTAGLLMVPARRWLTHLLVAGSTYAVLSLGLLWTLLAARIEWVWSSEETAMYLGGTAAGVTLAWLTGSRLTEREPPLTQHLVLTVLVGATALVLAGNGSLKFGQLGGALAMSQLCLAVAAIRRPEDEALRHSAYVTLPAWLFLLTCGAHLAELPWWLAIFLGAGSLTLATPHGPTEGLPKRQVGAALVVALIALGITGALQEPLDPASSGEIPHY
jgi:hypothetical protein